MTITINGSGTIAGISQGGLNDNIITQSELANTGVAGNGPAFSAYASTTTSVANATSVKIVFATKEFDTATCFDTATSRFTPTVAGYYQFDAQFTWTTAGTSATGITRCQLYKNGAALEYTDIQNSTAIGVFGTAKALVYMNGTTDYAEIYAFQNSGSAQTVNNQQNTTRFSGALVRAA